MIEFMDALQTWYGNGGLLVTLLNIVLIVFLAFVFDRLICGVIDRAMRGKVSVGENNRKITLKRVLKNLSHYLFVFIALIMILSEIGINVASILAAAPWTADGQHTLLLQPQSHAEDLRRFLMDHGYAIRREALVYDRGTIYPCMEAAGGDMTLSLGQLWGGAKLLRDPLGDRYLIEKIIRLQGAVAGLNRSSRPEDVQKADRVRDILTALLAMREEWRHANCP